MKRFLSVWLVLACLMAALAAPAHATIHLNDGRIYNCNDWVSMRVAPSTSAKVLVRVPYGAWVRNVTVETYSDAFKRCTYNGYTGYILSQYVNCDEMADFDAARVVNCKSRVSLRARPSTRAQQLIKVPLDAYVSDVYYVENDFMHCRYAGYEGYILGRYLDIEY